MYPVQRTATLRVHLVAGLLMLGGAASSYTVFADDMNWFALLVGQQVWEILSFVVVAMLPLVVCFGAGVFAARRTHDVAAGVWAGAVAAALYGAAFLIPGLVTSVVADWEYTNGASRAAQVMAYTFVFFIACAIFIVVGTGLGALGGLVGVRLLSTRPHRSLPEQ